MEQIHLKDKKPEGFLKKNTQSVLIIGLSLFIIIVVLMTGDTRKKAVASVDKAVSRKLNTLNEQRLQEFQKRLEEQETIIKEQHKRLTLQNQTGLIQTEDSGAPAVIISDDAIQQDIQKREYEALFASNVALSYRGRAQDREPGQADTFTAFLHAMEKPFLNTPTETAITQTPTLSDETISPQEDSLKHSPIPSPTVFSGTEKGCAVVQPEDSSSLVSPSLLPQGTLIDTLLINRLIGNFSGPVKCMVTHPVYSMNRQSILIPEGTFILGESRDIHSQGQQRLAVSFSKMVFPNGNTVNLDAFPGLNQIGATALKDSVNRHYLQIFGSSIALGLISGWATHGSQYGYVMDSDDIYRAGVSDSLSSSAVRILDRFLNIMPTITIHEGHRVKIFLTSDLNLEPYLTNQTQII